MEIKKEKPKGPKKGLLRRLAGNWGIRIVVIGLLGLGAYEAYQHYTDSNTHQTAEISNPSTTFDNAAKKGVIGQETIVSMPQSEIDKLFPDPFSKTELENEKISNIQTEVPNPLYDSLAIGDNIPVLSLEYPLNINSSSNPNAKISSVKRFAGTTLVQEAVNDIKGKGIYDEIEFSNIPGSTTIISPIDGKLQIVKENASNEEYNILIIYISCVAPNGNQYTIMIDGYAGNQKHVLKSPISLQGGTVDSEGKYIWSNPIEIKRGEPILETLKNKSVNVVLQIIHAVKGKVNEHNIFIPTGIELNTQNGKLLLPSGK